MRAADREVAGDLATFAGHFLIDDRFLEFEPALADADLEVTTRTDVHAFGPLHVESDGLRVRAGRHNEVIFKVALIAVKNQVHAGIQAAVFHAGVVRNVRAPLLGVIPDDVVRLAGEFPAAFDCRVRIATLELQPQGANRPQGLPLFGPRRGSVAGKLRGMPER